MTQSSKDLGEVIVCKGPPDCRLEDDAAVANQQAGCPMCKRIIMHPDGTETEYQKPTN
jgi:hypothetical protein